MKGWISNGNHWVQVAHIVGVIPDPNDSEFTAILTNQSNHYFKWQVSVPYVMDLIAKAQVSALRARV